MPFIVASCQKIAEITERGCNSSTAQLRRSVFLQAASNGLGPKVSRTLRAWWAERSRVARKHLCQARPGRRRRSNQTQRRRRPHELRAPTPTRIGRGIPGAAPQRDDGHRSRGNTGAPTPIPFGITNARQSSAICAVPASRKMTAAHAIACGDIKQKHSGGSHTTRGDSWPASVAETDRRRRRPLRHGVCRPSGRLRERNKLSGLAFRLQRHWEIRTCSSSTAFCCTTAFTADTR